MASILPNWKIAETKAAPSRIAANQGRADQGEGEDELHRAGGLHEVLAIEAHGHGRVLEEERERPLGIGPFLDGRPHQGDGGGVAHHVEGAQAEQVPLERRQHEVGGKTKEDRIIGEMEGAVLTRRDGEQGNDAGGRERQGRAP